MSCIVSLVDEGLVWMGADSAGVQGLSLRDRLDPKIYRVGQFLIGFTSSYRMGQLLGYSLVPPEHPVDMDNIRYMSTLFVDAVRDTLKAGGYAKKENEEESGGEFMVGYRGVVYHIESDYQVAIHRQNYTAIGCGEDLALGSLYSTEGQDPVRRIQTALGAAAKFSAGVQAPFVVMNTGKWK